MNFKLKAKLAEHFSKTGERQYNVEHKINLPHCDLSRIIYGHRSPTDQQKQEIAKILGCLVEDIFPEEQTEEQQSAAIAK